ncbi:MAG: tetratricopeptide repeat protein, partial [Myxococcaceae bacterium]|nr:tetratricopeptide repeat protein [Myxococcaceae bacterium]
MSPTRTSLRTLCAVLCGFTLACVTSPRPVAQTTESQAIDSTGAARSSVSAETLPVADAKADDSAGQAPATSEQAVAVDENAQAPSADAATAEPPPPPPLAPEVVDAFSEALSALAADQPEVALSKFQSAAGDDPRTAVAHHNLGLLLERSGDMAAAEEAYKKSLALDPSQKAAAQNLARLNLRQNRARESIAFFESLRSQMKPTGAIHDALATLFVETGRVEEAIASAKAALKIDEMDTAAMSLLAQAYFLQERHELALLVLGNALAISPGDPVLANQQGVVLLAQGKRQEARTLFQKAADAQSDFPEAQSNLGALLLAAQNFRAAAEHLELALKYAPDFVEARINLASAYRGLGDFAKAKALYEQ